MVEWKKTKEEAAMKTAFLIIAAGLVLATDPTARAQVALASAEKVRTCARLESYQSVNVCRFERHFVNCLRHEVNGIVECAIREAALIKLAQPDANCPGIKHELDRLASEGGTPAIRFKAWLAVMVYENPGLFIQEGKRQYVSDEDVFTALSDRLKATLLASEQ
jgi:hypothetical protein